MENLRNYFSKRQEILLAYLFGSEATKRKHKLSDFDIAIYSDPNQMRELNTKEPYGYQVAVLSDLIGLLKRNDIDLVILNRATPLLSYEVVRRGQIIFCRNMNFRIEYEIHVFKKYVDTKKLRGFQNYYLEKRIEKGLFGKTGI